MNPATFANCAWLAGSLPAWYRFRRGLRHPRSCQDAALRRLLSRNATCSFGRAHRFDTIRSDHEFRERVPIATYESLEPWIERLTRGESSVLTTEAVLRLLPTSGSTGARKLIPFTASFQEEFNAAIGPWIVDLWRQHPGIALGPAYWSISPAIPAPLAGESSAIPIGFEDDSAFLGGTRKRLVETALAVPSELRLVPDIETARYLTLLCLLRHRRLSLISVWHPSFLTLLLDALPRFWSELISDIRSGECARAASLPESARQRFHGRLGHRRADELRSLGPENPCKLWPHLRVISCWGDAQSASPAANLAERMPGVVVQPKGLLATEGVISIPFQGLRPLALHSHFLEFADDADRIWPADQLRLGGIYQVILTTGAGLWRYRLGDLVEVDGFVENTPSVKFLGRGQGALDLCGEKLTEPFVTRAISAALLSCGAVAPLAFLAPEHRDGGWRYTLFVEGQLPVGFTSRLDDALQANPHYALCRKLDQLGEVQLCSLPPGATDHFLKLQTADGRRLGDVKPPSLLPQTDWRNRLQACVR